MTTAAGLWASACIGLVIGIGFFECGIVATLAVYVIIRNFKKLEDRITFNDGWFSVYVRLEDVSNLSDFYTGIKDMGMKVGEVQVYDKKHEFKGAIVSIQNCAHRDREDVLSLLNSLRGVIDVKYISWRYIDIQNEENIMTRIYMFPHSCFWYFQSSLVSKIDRQALILVQEGHELLCRILKRLYTHNRRLKVCSAKQGTHSGGFSFCLSWDNCKSKLC